MIKPINDERPSAPTLNLPKTNNNTDEYTPKGNVGQWELVQKLSQKEMQLAAFAGSTRAIEMGTQVDFGAPPETRWKRQLEGCMAEFALSKFLGLHWPGVGEPCGFDVGGVDCRQTDRQNNRLILHPRDEDSRVFWLVCGSWGTYTIKGWILGRDGKQDKFWSDPTGKGRPAYFVPQGALNSPYDWPGAPS